MITWKKTKAQKDKIFWTQWMRDVLATPTLKRPATALRRNYNVPAHHFDA